MDNAKIILSESTILPPPYNTKEIGLVENRRAQKKQKCIANVLPFRPLPRSQPQENPEDSAGCAHCHKHQLLLCLYEPLPQLDLQYL